MRAVLSAVPISRIAGGERSQFLLGRGLMIEP
jgi:hypothetical protein